MDLKSQWQSLVESSVKMNFADFVKETREGIQTQPLYYTSPIPQTFVAHSPKQKFLNILPFDDHLWGEEFVSFPGAAVQVVDHEQLAKTPAAIKTIFLNSFQWRQQEEVEKILGDTQSERDYHFCWDPWRRRLHHGKMNRWPQDYFPVELLNHEGLDNVHAFRFSSEIYSLAGASTVQELAVLLATIVESLRNYQGRITPENLCRQISLELSLSVDTLWNAAKIQALKLLVARLFESMELPSIQIPIFTCPSLRYFGSREPWSNLLRLTLMQSASLIGGANGFRHYPFDVFNKEPLEQARLSRNIGLILQLESGLNFVTNPVEGSGLVSDWVEQMCEKSWTCLQEIESKGGLIASLQSGWIQEEIELSHQNEWKRIKSGTKPLVGVNQFVNLEKLSERYGFSKATQVYSILDWWERYSQSETTEKEFTVRPLVPQQLSQSFEKFQMASDETLAKAGRRPSLFVYCRKPESNKDKLKWLREVATTAGYTLRMESEIKKNDSAFACCVGGDPDADTWPDDVEQLRQLGYRKVVWIGEKKKEIFDDTWSRKTEKLEICKRMHEWGGVKHDS